MTEWKGGEWERWSGMETDLNERVGEGKMGEENESHNGSVRKEKVDTREIKCEEV